MSSVQHGWFQLSIKRICDIVVALLVLAMLSPLFLLAIVLIKLEPRSPVFSVRRKNCYGLNVSVWRFSTETFGKASPISWFIRGWIVSLRC